MNKTPQFEAKNSEINWDDLDCIVDQEHSDDEVQHVVRNSTQISNKLITDKGKVKAEDFSLFTCNLESSVCMNDALSQEQLERLTRTHNVECVNNTRLEVPIVHKERRFSQNLPISENDKKEMWKMWRNKPSREILEQILPQQSNID